MSWFKFAIFQSPQMIKSQDLFFVQPQVMLELAIINIAQSILIKSVIPVDVLPSFNSSSLEIYKNSAFENFTPWTHQENTSTWIEIIVVNIIRLHIVTQTRNLVPFTLLHVPTLRCSKP